MEDTESGPRTKRIPLDPRAPTWEWKETEINGQVMGRWARSRARVSHFSTCPNANDFSASNRPQQQEPVQQDLLARRPYKED